MLCVLPHTNRTCPATNQVVAGSRKVVLLFATKSVHIRLMHEGPTENRLGELGSLYKYYYYYYYYFYFFFLLVQASDVNPVYGVTTA